MTSQALLIAAATDRTFFEFGRYQSNTDLILPLAVFIAAVVFVRVMYVRDSAELGSAVGWLLTTLRVLAFAGLLFVYMQPQWRTERELTNNSRVMLLVDTSLSMAHSDFDSPSVPSGTTRADRVIAALQESDFLRRLRETHDVDVVRFDEDSRRLVELRKLPSTPSAAETETAISERDADEAHEQTDEPPNWEELLAPRGAETRLGSALRQWIREGRTAPLSGVIVITDGGQNAGVGPTAAVMMAREAKIPIHAIGLGSDRQPTNVRVVDLAAPPRAYPGDVYPVSGHVQAQGMAGRTVVVELLSQAAEGPGVLAEGGVEQLEASEQVTLDDDGKIVPVRFELTPTEIGGRELKLRVKAPAGDTNPNDDEDKSYVEIVDHVTRVLLVAGGPTREYRFLRNLLYRDGSTEVDVVLQTAQQGISQDANRILDSFPSTRAELYEYDAIVAFDPDWQQLSSDEIDLLESWVAEQAGGLVVVAGPIYTQRWTQDPRMGKLRALYPVEFRRQFALPLGARYGSKEPWPIEFTSEGEKAEFLWLDDTAIGSQRNWASFEGVYGFYDVNGAKPAATVYGRFGDPTASPGKELPVFLAGQIYGGGRVFYIGSGEFWRLRGVDEAYFDRFYTKLIRYVSQRRLLRGSTRGTLFTAEGAATYQLGDTITIHAQLTDQQFEPLTEPTVSAQVLLPDRSVVAIRLTQSATRAGSYVGQFAARQQGSYQVDLPVGESSNEVLTLSIRVKVPDLESEHLERNDALLSQIARDTGGRYYVGLEKAIGFEGNDPVTDHLPDASEILPLSDKPQSIWDNEWMMFALCGVFCLEWLIRRLAKLA